MALRLALEVWGHDYAALVATARAAEDLGFDALYYGESPHALNLETSTVLAGLAERTSTLRLGSVIANLLPGYRSFTLFARQAHALAVISGGRFDLRTGTGAASEAARPWWEPAGVDYPDRPARRRILEDWLRAVHLLWSEPGKLAPAVARPPITVAAVGPASMAIAARYADVWESSYLCPDEFRALAAQFEELAAERGGAVLRSVEVDAVTGPTAETRSRLEARFLAERGDTGAAALTKALRGSPQHVAEQMAAYRAAGVDQLLIAAVDPHDRSILEALAEAAALL